MKKAMLLIPLLFAACATSSSPTLAITNVTVIDMVTSAAHPASTVIIRGGNIVAIGAVPVPRNARVVDGRGKYLIPAFFDMHTHVSFWGADAFPRLVRFGVLAIRDLGGDLDELDRWRAEIDRGDRVGPRIFRAGPYLDGPKEYDSSDNGKLRAKTTITVRTAEEGRAAVDSLKKRGVDTIKTHNALSKEAYLAIADECKRQRLPLATHLASPTVTIEEASDVGATTIEHIEMLTESICFKDVPPGGKPTKGPLAALDDLTDAYASELFRRFARNGTTYDPTLVAYRTFMQEAVNLAPKDPRYEKAAAGRTKMFNRFVQLVGLMHKNGVPVTTGSDFGIRPETVPYPVPDPGSDLHDELKLFVEGGFTPMEALQSATIVPARVLRVADRMGSIERGKEADLILLDADPLTDIANTRKIAGVVVRGRFLDRAELEK